MSIELPWRPETKAYSIKRYQTRRLALKAQSEFSLKFHLDVDYILDMHTTHTGLMGVRLKLFNALSDYTETSIVFTSF